MNTNFKIPPWEQWEEDVVIRIFPNGGAEPCLEHLPRRTFAAISMRACRLRVFNLKRKHPPGNKNCKPPLDRLHPITVRSCLRCSDDFPSDGPHNRICTECKASSAWRDGVYMAEL